MQNVIGDDKKPVFTDGMLAPVKTYCSSSGGEVEADDDHVMVVRRKIARGVDYWQACVGSFGRAASKDMCLAPTWLGQII